MQRPPPPRAHSCSTRSPSRPARPLSAVTRRGGAVPPALSSRPAPRTSASLTPPTRHSSRWHFLLPGPGVGKGGPALSRPASAQSRGCRHAPDVAGCGGRGRPGLRRRRRREGRGDGRQPGAASWKIGVGRAWFWQ